MGEIVKLLMSLNCNSNFKSASCQANFVFYGFKIRRSPMNSFETSMLFI